MYSERELKRKQIQLISGQGLSIPEVAKTVGVEYKTAKKWSNIDGYKHNYDTI
jgi:transposase